MEPTINAHTALCDARWSLPPLRRGVKLGWRACRTGAATFGQWRSHGRCCRLVLTSAALTTPVAHPWQPHEPITTRRRCWSSWRRVPQSDVRVATHLSQIERLHRTVDLCRAAGALSHHCSAHTLINPASPPVSCAAALCKLPRQCDERRTARVPWCEPAARPAPRVDRTTMATRRPPAAPGTSAPASRRSPTTVAAQCASRCWWIQSRCRAGTRWTRDACSCWWPLVAAHAPRAGSRCQLSFLT
jgi:hypothetical protein